MTREEIHKRCAEIKARLEAARQAGGESGGNSALRCIAIRGRWRICIRETEGLTAPTEGK